MFQPGEAIKLNTHDLGVLGHTVSEMIDDLERTYRPYFEALRVWQQWYEARPLTNTKNFPFANASNIVVPLSQVMSDAMVNRAYAGFFGSTQRNWIAKTEDEKYEKVSNNIARFVNWASNNNDFNFRLNAWDWLNEWVPMGASVMCGNWRDDVRQVFVRQGRGDSSKVVSRPVRFARGVVFETPPREQLLWDTNHLIGDAPFVAREYQYTWQQIRQIATANEWNEEAVEFIKGHGGLEGPSSAITRTKAELDLISFDPALLMRHDIREVHADWPIFQSMGLKAERVTKPADAMLDHPEIPIVIYLHRKTRKVLHVKAEPYFFPQKPFFDGFYSKRAGRGHTVGLVKRLEGMQQAMTTLLNQSIDARTRANSVWARTSLRENQSKPLDPSTMIYDPGLATVAFEKLQTGTFEDMTVFTMVNTLAERLTGQADPAMGRETRSGGHPSPATSTLALLQQSDIVSGGRRELARMQLSRMGSFAATLYQQYEADPTRLVQLLGESDARDVLSFLQEPVAGNLKFDMVAMNESTNPDSEMRRAIAVSQMNTNYWAFVLRAIQAAQQARQMGDPILMQASVVSIQAQTKAHLRFLEAGDVDDIEQFVLQLDRANQAGGPGSPDVQSALGGLGEMAGAGGAVARPDLGRPARPDERLPLFAAGGFGGGAQLQ